MFTNVSNYGGNFKSIIDSELNTAEHVSIASGYTSLDIIHQYHDPFIEIARNGGSAKLLLGMAFYEGLGQKKLNALRNLNSELSALSQNSGVFVARGRRYHGKVYSFKSNDATRLYVGSSNFSSSGLKGNIECTVPITSDTQKAQLIKFLKALYSDDYSIPINKANITIPGKKRIIRKTLQDKWDSLKRHDPAKLDLSNLPSFEIDLRRIAAKEKSNLNIYFGKGRLNSKTGIVTPRPWYEIEIICDQLVRENALYPQGDFDAYTDDGLIIPMRTQGDYNKNLRSKDSLQIFGIWLKGRLEKAGVLQKYQPVTIDSLEEFSKTSLTLYKIDDNSYFMSF